MRRFSLTAAILVVTALYLGEAVAQTNPPPYGYLVYYGLRDGKPFDNGAKFRLVGVTRSHKEKQDWLNEINSIHRYRAYVKELQDEKTYAQALALVKEMGTSRPRPDPIKPSDAPDFTGTSWVVSAEDNLWLKSNSRFELGRSKGLVSNQTGNWRQEGNKLILRFDDGYQETWTYEGGRLRYGLRTMRPR